jgi:hypothetical protein
MNYWNFAASPGHRKPAPAVYSMALYILIGLVLASFVIAFFSARTWHWGHVIVVLGIVLATGGFFILAAETLRINSVYRSAIDRKTKELEQLTAVNDALRNGTDDPSIMAQLRNEAEPAVAIPENAESIPSLADLDHQILLATRLRGRVWRDVAPAAADASGTVRLAAVPAGLKKDTVVYVFEEGPAQLPAADGRPQGKQYLGEFRVTEPAAQQIALAPLQPLDQFEQRRLAASRGPWVVYETMPPDRHQLFAGMTEEQLRQRVPPQSVGEYIRHGQEANPDDDDARKQGLDADGKPLPSGELAGAAKVIYQRRLRDYAAEFDELSRRRVDMEVSKAAVQKDIDRLTAALASAKKLQASREAEVKRLTTDLTGVKKERQTIEQHLAKVRQQLARVRELLDNTLKQNSELADRLAEIQLGATVLTTPLLQPEP